MRFAEIIYIDIVEALSCVLAQNPTMRTVFNAEIFAEWLIWTRVAGNAETVVVASSQQYSGQRPDGK